MQNSSLTPARNVKLSIFNISLGRIKRVEEESPNTLLLYFSEASLNLTSGSGSDEVPGAKGRFLPSIKTIFAIDVQTCVAEKPIRFYSRNSRKAAKFYNTPKNNFLKIAFCHIYK